MAAAARPGPYRPLALAAASPWTNSTSPRAHLLRAVSAVHRARLDEHGGTHVVTAVDVGGQLVEQIPLVGDARGAKVPEMVMGIADGHLRLQRRFRGQREPVIASEWHDAHLRGGSGSTSVRPGSSPAAAPSYLPRPWDNGRPRDADGARRDSVDWLRARAYRRTMVEARRRIGTHDPDDMATAGVAAPADAAGGGRTWGAQRVLYSATSSVRLGPRAGPRLTLHGGITWHVSLRSWR